MVKYKVIMFFRQDAVNEQGFADRINSNASAALALSVNGSLEASQVSSGRMPRQESLGHV